ncbi:MAG: LysE family translocator [Chloroflexota bacterium]
MFDYTLLHWVTFFTVAFLLNIAPGPDIAFILGQTFAHGRRGGYAAMFGIWSGASLHVLMAGLGLSAILATSAVAFSVVKWVGAAYLLWLGFQALRSDGSGLIREGENGNDSFGFLSVYREGALVAALNPKTAIFFLAFLPQFVEPGAGTAWAQLFLHGFLVIGVAAIVEPPIVWAAASLRRFLRRNETIGRLIDRSLGALFIALGLRLAFSRQ